MTYQDLQFYESEVVALIDKVLDAVREKSFKNYVLLIARGGYQYENEKTFLSPFVISSRQEIYLDRTRDMFLVTYLNNYASMLKDGIFMTDDYREYDLNIQMMIYAQIWESHQFLKTLKRIGDILTGKPYEWKIPFEKPDRNGIMRPVHKGNMIQEQILKNLSKTIPDFAHFIDGIYDGQLRNDFAHATYYISVEDNAIISLDSERFSIKKRTDLFDWEQMFIYSVLTSYHLSHCMRERCKKFMVEYPDLDCVEIDWPSYNEPGKMLRVQIKPEKRGDDIEFNFVRQR